MIGWDYIAVTVSGKIVHLYRCDECNGHGSIGWRQAFQIICPVCFGRRQVEKTGCGCDDCVDAKDLLLEDVEQ